MSKREKKGKDRKGWKKKHKFLSLFQSLKRKRSLTRGRGSRGREGKGTDTSGLKKT